MTGGDGLEALVPRLDGRRVLIVGDVILDEYLTGRTTRVSPEAPVPVIELGDRFDRAGGAANVAAGVARLGGRVLLLGVVGDDDPARRLRDALATAGVDPSGLVIDPGRPTTTKTRVIARNQQVARLDRESRDPLSPGVEDRLLGRLDREPLADAVILSDYAKGVLSHRVCAAAVGRARAAGVPSVVDPKGADVTKYAGATVVKPNADDVAALVGRPVAGVAELGAAAGAVLDRLPGSAVLVTRGPDGMSLFRRGRPPRHVPARALTVFDVTGAGDTVTAVLGLALAAGADLEAAVVLAARAAGVVVGKLGTAAVSPDELRAACRDR